MGDTTFQAKVYERWAVIYPYLQSIPTKIQQYGGKLKASYEVNSAMWPTDRDSIHEYKSDFKDWSGDEQIEKFEDVINTFVNSYQSRLSGMDALIANF